MAKLLGGSDSEIFHLVQDVSKISNKTTKIERNAFWVFLGNEELSTIFPRSKIITYRLRQFLQVCTALIIAYVILRSGKYIRWTY